MSRSSRAWDHLSGNDLPDYLNFLNGDLLRRMLKRLSIPKPHPTRKADMIAAISGRLTGDFLRYLWNLLDEIEQLAVREALFDPDRQLDRKRFLARYGALPAQPEDYYKRIPAPLEFFLYPQSRHTSLPSTVPEDLGERLREFVLPPPEVALAVEEALPESFTEIHHDHGPEDEGEEYQPAEPVHRDMERAAARDLSAVLRLVDLGRVAVSAKTRWPSAAAAKRISEELHGGDFFGPDDRDHDTGRGVGPIRAFAWPMLLQAGRLAEVHGSQLALTKAGRAAFGAPPSDTLKRLWQRWVGHGILDEFSRIDIIGGQHRGKGKSAMTAVPKRRQVVAEALKRCPVGQWVSFDGFSRFMRADGYDFEITHDPWKLYVGDAHYGSLGHSAFHRWEILQDRYILCLLFEYAATLGLIDIAYTHPENARLDYMDLWASEFLDFLSRYDGLRYFRLNPLGAYCLGVAEAYEPQMPPDRTPLRVFPDLRLCAEVPMSPEERLVLETWANAEADGVWRLDRARTLAAVEDGHDVDGLRTFLTARDDQPLPEKVEGFLRSVERGEKALRERGWALLVECASEEIAARLAADGRVSMLCLPAGKKHLAVHAKSEAAFRKAIRELGYGMPRT